MLFRSTAGVPDDILQVYIDDFLVMSTDLESHIRWLDTVFQRLRNAGVNLEPKKTSLFQKSVDFVGFQLAESSSPAHLFVLVHSFKASMPFNFHPVFCLSNMGINLIIAFIL